MPYSVKILLDSINTAGDRLTTFELTYPRFIHSEFMTHRVFSRNSSSSRAIPIEKMIERVKNDPVIPVYWGENQKGMQAGEELSEYKKRLAESDWLVARNEAIRQAKGLMGLGVHKQIVNRLLEPWMWITVICSSTTYGNFFNLRYHPDAQPEIQKLAALMWKEYSASYPQVLEKGEWHMPLLPDQFELEYEWEPEFVRKISVGRCARVSYLTHNRVRDPKADIELHDRLLKPSSNPDDPKHMSPFEHVSEAYPGTQFGNFQGWKQYRKFFLNENRPHFKGPKTEVCVK